MTSRTTLPSSPASRRPPRRPTPLSRRPRSPFGPSLGPSLWPCATPARAPPSPFRPRRRTSIGLTLWTIGRPCLGDPLRKTSPRPTPSWTLVLPRLPPCHPCRLADVVCLNVFYLYDHTFVALFVCNC